jgi:hypothetical protein
MKTTFREQKALAGVGYASQRSRSEVIIYHPHIFYSIEEYLSYV